MNLLFAINRQYTGLLLSCLNSIAANGGDERYHAYVLHSDLDAATETALALAAPPAVTLRFIPVDPAMFAGFPVFKRYPVQIYYRLAAPLLLPKELERILYLDVDTVVINPLTELYQADFAGNLFMACTHTQELLTNVNRARLGIKTDAPYLNTGVMLLNLAALREELDLAAIQIYAREHEAALLLPDQDILTALYGDRVKLLDSLIYNLSDRLLAAHNANPKNARLDVDWVRQNTVVIHYYGRNKPWQPHYHGVLGEFYAKYRADGLL